MDEMIYSLSPSQAYELIQSLREKKEYEILTNEETEQLEQLTTLFSEVSPDFEGIDF